MLRSGIALLFSPTIVTQDSEDHEVEVSSVTQAKSVLKIL